MNHIQEPEDVDLFVGPSVLTEEIQQRISEALAAYRATHPRTEYANIEEAYRADVVGNKEVAPAA